MQDAAKIDQVQPGDGLPTIIDVPVAKFNALAIGMGLLIAVGFVFCLVVLAGTMTAILTALERMPVYLKITVDVLGMSGFVVVMLLVVRAHRFYWLNRCVEGVRTGEFVSHLKFIAEHGRVDLHRAASEWFVRHLVTRGVVGHGIRIDAWRKPTPITPLAQQFEPRLILEGSDDFEQFLSDEPVASGTASPSAAARDDSERRENRSVRLSIGRHFNLFFAISLLVAASAFFVAGGSLGGFSGPLAAIAAGSFVRMFAKFVARTAGKQWLAVPGGIVIRRPSGLGGRSSLHLMRRSNSLILATRQLTDAFWRVTISDGKLSAARTMSSNELVVALRAWTSPLEPPAMDRLTDWIGDA